MASKLATAFIEILALDKTDKGFNDARKKANKFISDITTGIGQGLGQAIAQGVGNLIRSGLDQIGQATSAANNLNEAIIRSQRVFGDSAGEIRAWAQTLDTSLAISENAALSNASAFGSMLLQFGVGRAEAAAMSKTLVEAAADVAVFSNAAGGTTQVLETFAAAFRQEYDSLQRFLPAISDAAIVQQALADSGKESAAQLTLNEKILATYTLILEGATLAQGSMADAIERGAAAGQVFAARMENARAEAGQLGLIVQQELFQTLNELLDQMGFFGENIVEQLVVGLTKGLVAITPFLAQLRQVFVSVLQPGSPPRLLPELNKWGKSAAEEYLKGWTQVDATMLEALGSSIETVLRSFVGAGGLKETDLVHRVFGSERAIVDAINEWRQLGSITVGTLDNIRRAAGPAGEQVGELVNSYFNLQRATQAQQAAQERLNEVTRKYDDALNPLNEKLDANARAQQKIRDAQRLEELGDIIGDRTADVEDRQLARLEQEEILLRQRADAIERERDTVVDAEQKKIDAAELERQQKEAIFQQNERIIEQQIRANELAAEEIALRERLAEEARAKEEKAEREREAARRKEEAELERVADAHLRYRLAIVDEEGQLAILQEELAKTVEGSAEYWQILTDIAQVQERIAARDAGGGGLTDIVTEAGKAAQESKPYLDDFRTALEGALGALTGGPEVELRPAFQNIVDGIGNVKRFIEEATPIVQGFIDLIMGKDVEGVEPGADPFAGNWWLEGLIPGLQNLILTLQQILDGDWATLWQRFKEYVDSVLNLGAGDEDGTTFFFYTWLKDTVIPLLEGLATGEWADAWNSFASAIQTGWDTAVAFIDGSIATITAAITGIATFVNEQLATLEGALQNFMERWGFPTNPFDPNLAPGQDVLPPSPFSNFPGVSPGVTIPASIANLGGTTHNATTNHNLGPINLVFNVPVTPEVARGAARTVDDELRARGWSPT